MKHASRTAFLATIAAAAAAAFPAHAADYVTKAAPALQSNAAPRAWTNAEYAAARTMLPTAKSLAPSVFDYNSAVSAASSKATQGSSKAGYGGASAAGLLEQRYLSAADLAIQQLTAAAADTSGGMAPDAVGTGGLQFTSARTTPVYASSTQFPFRTIGKLFFNQNGISYSCSGSMIKPGIVVTAGHCVHDGSGSAAGWSSAFQFIPGYSQVNGIDSRPYGTWTNWTSATTSTAWYSGGGVVPNIRDYAIIVFGANARGQRIGDITGWLGYQYPSMIGRHMTVLGYPGNIDAGLILHRVDSQTTDGGTNNGTWGSDMRGGSSGGPVVLNFRNVLSAPNPPTDNNPARVTGVVSWGYISTAPQVQGGSVFDSVFGDIITGACAAVPSPC